MAYVIYTQYIHDTTKIMEHGQAHMDYLARFEAQLIASGGLVDETGKIVGGCITLAVDSKAEAETFVANDPFTTKGVIKQVAITRWFQTFLHGRADQTAFEPLEK